MPQFIVTVTSLNVGSAGTDKLLVLTETDNLESASEKIQTWANEQYHGRISTCTEKLSNSNEVFVSDLAGGKFHKVIAL